MNWKIVAILASVVGIMSVVFAVVSAFVTYRLIVITSFLSTPTEYVQLTILSVMLQYLFYAIVSFTVAAFAARAGKQSRKETPWQPQVEIETKPSETAG